MNALEFHQPTRIVAAMYDAAFDAEYEAMAQFRVTLGPKNSPTLPVLDTMFIDGCTDESDADMDDFLGDLEGLTFAAIAVGRFSNGGSGMGGAL